MWGRVGDGSCPQGPGSFILLLFGHDGLCIFVSSL